LLYRSYLCRVRNVTPKRDTDDGRQRVEARTRAEFEELIDAHHPDTGPLVVTFSPGTEDGLMALVIGEDDIEQDDDRSRPLSGGPEYMPRDVGPGIRHTHDYLFGRLPDQQPPPDIERLVTPFLVTSDGVECFPAIWVYNLDGKSVSVHFLHRGTDEFFAQMIWDVYNGRLEPTAVMVSTIQLSAPVVGDLIRRIPVGALQRQARQDAGRWVDAMSSDGGLWDSISSDLQHASGGHRGVVASEAELEELREVYVRAWGLGEPVTEAVATHFNVSKSTAGKRIMKARKAGLLDGIGRIKR